MKSEGGELLLVDAGSFTGHQGATAEARGLFLLSMMTEHGYAGVNVGAEELGLGADLLRSLAAEKTSPMISANLEDEATGELVFPDARIVRAAGARVAVTGLTRPPPELADSVRAAGLAFRDPLDALERVLLRLDRDADVVVLLANLPESEARSLGERFAGRLDVVVLGRDARAFGDRHGPEHGGAVYLAAMDRGQAFGVARIALENGGVAAISGDEMLLGRDVEPDPETDAVVKEFESNLNELLREASANAIRERGSVDGQYFVGAGECRACHLREFELWAETPHSTAFKTLAEAGREALPECYRCHVTGHGQPTGYLPQRKDPDLVNVQCEVCHDRGSLHSRDGSYGRSLLMDACSRCHDSTNSPLWDPEVYWLMIEH